MKQLISFVLTFSMLLNLLPIAVFAEERQTGEESGVEEVTAVIESGQPLTFTIEETSAPEVTETPAPEVTETPAPEVTETPAPEVTETPAPEVTETPVPEVTETPVPEVTETPAPEVTETPAPEVTQGMLGEIVWEYNSGILTLSGSGALQDFEGAESAPWTSFSGEIMEIRMAEGITTIGSYAFYGCEAVEQLELPMGVTAVGAYAFGGCVGLKAVAIPITVTAIAGDAFSDCGTLVVYTERDCYACQWAEEMGYELVLPEVLPENSIASGTCGTYMTWSLSDSGVLTIAGSGSMNNYSATTHAPWYEYRESIVAVTIADTVTGIGNYAFAELSKVKTMVVPDGVTYLGDRVFQGLDALEELTIPYARRGPSYGSGALGQFFGSVTEETEGAVKQGSSYYGIPAGLKKVTVTKDTAVGQYCFQNCAGLEEVVLNDGITRIGSNSFDGCAALKALPNITNVTTIPAYAFRGCSNITKLEIPEGVTSIDGYAFVGVENIKSVVIPETVTHLGDGVFQGWDALEELTIPYARRGPSYGSGALGQFFGSVTEGTEGAVKQSSSYYGIPAGLKKVTVTKDTSIGQYFFQNCAGLEEVVLKDSITSIGGYAFDGCTSLKTVNLPASLTSIRDYAFRNCSLVLTEGLPEGLQDIGSYAFAGCPMTELHLPDTLTNIGKYAFSDMDKITEIVIPESVISYLGEGVFYGCDALEAITLPELSPGKAYSQVSLGYFFGSVTEDTEGAVKQGSSYYAIPAGLKKVTLTKATTVYSYAFQNCANLEEVVLNDGITTIYNYAFDGCTNLKTLPNLSGVTFIYDYAFRGCSRITSLQLPSGLETVGSNAFAGMDKITSVVVPDSVTYLGAGAFQGWDALKELTVPYARIGPNNSSGTLGLFFGSVTAETEGAAKQGSNYYAIPDSLKKVTVTKETLIYDYAFQNCSNLRVINLNDGITRIGSYAFDGCTALTELRLPEGITSIPQTALMNNNLSYVGVPDSMTNFSGLDNAELEHLIWIVYPGSEAEAYAQENDIAYTYQRNKVGDLTVSIETEENWSGYRGMTLEAAGEAGKVVLPVTESTQYTFYQLAAEQAYTVRLLNGYGDVLAQMDVPTVELGANACTLTNILPVTTVSLRVRDEHNTLQNKQGMIRWTAEGKAYADGEDLAGVPVGKVLTATFQPGEALRTSYAAPEPLEITASQKTTIFGMSLVPRVKYTLSGKVLNSDGAALAAASVTATQWLDGKQQVSATVLTDAQGTFSLPVYEGTVSLSAVLTGYEESVAELEMVSKNTELEDITLRKLEGAAIHVTVDYLAAGETEATTLSELKDLSFSVTAKEDGRAVKSVAQNGIITLLEELPLGTELIVHTTSRSNTAAPVATEVTLTGESSYVLAVTVMGYGKISAAYDGKQNVETRMMVFDASGKMLWTQRCDGSGTQVSGILPDGEYTVVLMGDSNFFASPTHLDDLTVSGLKAEKDYLQVSAVVCAGTITKLDAGAVPFFDETRFYYTDPDRSQMTLSKTTVTAGQNFTVRASAKLEEEYEGRASDFRWIFDYSDGCVYLDRSLLIGLDSAMDVKLEDGRITVGTVSPEKTVRFCLTALQSGTAYVNAWLEFTLDGETIRQPVDNSQIQVEALGFELPTRVNETTVRVVGTAPKSAQVELYDNGILVGKTGVAGTGKWTLSFELHKPYSYSEHDIYARITMANGNVIETEEKTLIYQQLESGVTLSHVKMIYRSYTTIFDFIKGTTTGTYYSFVPSSPSFSFLVYFEGEDLTQVQDVVLNVELSDGSVSRIYPQWNEASGCWAVSEKYTSSALPVNVTVNYNIDSDIIYSAEEEEHWINVWVNLNNSKTESLKLPDETSNIELPKDPALDPVREEVKTAVDTYNSAIKEVKDSLTELERLYNDELSEYMQFTDSGIVVELGGSQCTISQGGTITEQNLLDSGYRKDVASDGSGIYSRNPTENDEDIIIHRPVSEQSGTNDGTDYSLKGSVTYESINNIPHVGADDDVIEAVEKTKKFVDGVDKYNDKLQLATAATANLDKTITKVGNITDDMIAFYAKELNSGNISDFQKYIYRENLNDMEGLRRGLIKEKNLVNNTVKVLKPISNVLGFAIELLDWSDMNEAIKLLSESDSYGDRNAARELLKTELIMKFAGIGFSLMMFLPGVGLVGAGAIVAGQAIMKMIRDNQKDKILKRRQSLYNQSHTGSPSTPNIDPSGYVYEAVDSNRISDVTATCYQKQTLYDMYDEPYEVIEVWDATPYDQINPQLTNENGQYGWDVPVGLWRVGYEKDGYATAYSEWMEVPPPRFDVNVGIVSYAKPEIAEVRAGLNGLEVTFSKYMKPDTISSETLTVTLNGNPVAGHWELLNEEVNPKNSEETFVSKVRFVPEAALIQGDVLQVVTGAGLRSYANVAMDSGITAAAPVVVMPDTLECAEELVLAIGDTTQLTLKALPAEFAAGKTVILESSGLMFTLSENKITLDSEGCGIVTVTGVLPGADTITCRVEGSDLQQIVNVTVNNLNSAAVAEMQYNVVAESGVHLRDSASNRANLVAVLYPPETIMISKTAEFEDCVWGYGVTGTGLDGWLIISNPNLIVKAPPKLESITAPESITIGVKETVQLKPMLTAAPQDADTTGLRFSSGNTAVVAVDVITGEITGKKTGTTVITITAENGMEAQVTVSVLKAPSKVTLDIRSATLGAGETLQLKASLPSKTASFISWESSEPHVAAVDNGLITALNPGTTTITARTFNNKTATCTVTVGKRPNTFTLDLPENVGVGAKFQAAVIIPEGAAGSFSYMSSDSSVMEVDENGKITALALGEATITVTAYTGKSRSQTITVMEKPTKIQFIESAAQMGVGQEISFAAAVNEGAAGPITYSSSKSSVAKVSKDGVVTALKAGSAKITAKTYNGKTASVTVKVIKAPTELTLNTYSLQMCAPDGDYVDTAVLKAELTKNSFNSLVWENSNPSVVTLENGVLTAHTPGDALITVTSYNGLTAQCAVTVHPAPETIAPAEALVTIGLGMKQQAAVVNGEGAKLQGVRYTSANPKLVTVTEGGQLTGKKIGTATITAESYNGKTTEFEVSVIAAPKKVSFTSSVKQLGVGQSFRYAAQVNEGAVSPITYTSSNKSVASVSEDGTVTALKAGSAKITAKAYNGKSASVTLKVIKAPTDISLSESVVHLGSADNGCVDTVQLKATVTKGSFELLDWQSSDSGVVSVENGLLVAGHPGEATISVISYNGLRADCEVKVCEAPKALCAADSVVTLGVGMKRQSELAWADGTYARNIRYTSDNPKLVTVTEEGQLTGKKVGTVTITAESYNGKTTEFEVSVIAAPKKVSFTSSVKQLGVGQSFRYAAQVNEGAVSPITYTSSNKSVASVSEDGTVTALKAGSAKITAKAYNGKSARVTLKVIKAPTDISLSESVVQLGSADNGCVDTAQLKATVTKGSFELLDWQSSDPGVVSVENGLLVAGHPGEAVVSVISYNGLRADCIVTVHKAPESLSVESGAVTIGVGMKQQTELCLEEGSYARNIRYTSDNSKLVTVTEGGQLTGKKVGTATITVESYNGKTTSFTVNVIAAPKKVSFTSSVKQLGVGQSFRYAAQVNEGAVSPITYTSSNKSVASVSEDGTVTALKAGSAKITAKAYNGKSASVILKVIKAPTEN